MPLANGPITDVYCGGERVSLIEKKDYLAFFAGECRKTKGYGICATTHRVN